MLIRNRERISVRPALMSSAKIIDAAVYIAEEVFTAHKIYVGFLANSIRKYIQGLIFALHSSTETYPTAASCSLKEWSFRNHT